MILILRNGAAESSAAQVCQNLQKLGLSSQIVIGPNHTFIVVISDTSTLPTHLFSQLEGVEKVVRAQPQCPLVLERGAMRLDFENGATIGGGGVPILIAGPCSVESRGQIMSLSRQIKEAGAQMLRGGAFKPRTSPYDFRGLGQEALEYMKEARQATGLPVVSEVMSPQQVEMADEFVDVYQIGARNMYNYDLLREVGKSNHPVLLKRALSATIAEFLQSAEYILLEGNLRVILCERGIRTFETHTRNTLDLTAVAALKTMTALPVLVDPSHGTGRRDLIRPMSRAAIACGADGLLIEVHADPSRALSDGAQAITPAVLRQIRQDMVLLHTALSDARDAAPESFSAVVDQPLLSHV